MSIRISTKMKIRHDERIYICIYIYESLVVTHMKWSYTFYKFLCNKSEQTLHAVLSPLCCYRSIPYCSAVCVALL